MSKRTAIPASIVLLSLALACDKANAPSAPGASASLAAQQDGANCTTASLVGSYGLLRAGTSGGAPIRAVGLVTYDGAGNWVATQSISRNGAFTFDVVTRGEYVVASDCRGKLFSNGQEIGRLALADRGDQVFHLSETAGDAVFDVQKRVESRGCSNASVHGAYGFYRTGVVPAGPLAAVGMATYDGAGMATATQTISRNGVIIPDVTVGPHPYEVSADCTGKLFLDGRELARVVVVERGRERFQLSQSPGNTVTGVQRKLHGTPGIASY